MQKGFLQNEDWTTHFCPYDNPCWAHILKIVQENQYIVKKETEEIIEYLNELPNRKVQLLRHYNKYKKSLQYSSQNSTENQNVDVIPPDNTKYFFPGYTRQIKEIICQIAQNPRLFARILAESKIKKFENQDFVQSILYHFYPYYLTNVPGTMENKGLAFIEQIIKLWNYDINQGRPSKYTIIDQVINGFHKIPEIASYTEKICMVFMREINKVKIDEFAFDISLVKQELKLSQKNPKTQRSMVQPPKGFFSRIFGTKQKNPEISTFSTYSDSLTSDIDDCSKSRDPHHILKARQNSLAPVIRETILKILSSQPPQTLCLMLYALDQQLRKQIETSPRKLSINSEQQQNHYYRHYSFFILTNLISDQLHTRFAVKHQENCMEAASLHNFTEIVKIINAFFQGVFPQPKQYLGEQIVKIQIYHKDLTKFYEKIIQKGRKVQLSLNFEKDKTQKILGEIQELEKVQIRKTMRDIFEKHIIVSFNDIKHVVELVKNSQLKNQLNLSESALSFGFLQDEKNKKVFQLENKYFYFKDTKFQCEKLFFQIGDIQKQKSKIITYYLGKEQPLESLTLLIQKVISESKFIPQCEDDIQLIWPKTQKIRGFHQKVRQSFNNQQKVFEICSNVQFIKNLNFQEMKFLVNRLSKIYNDFYFDGADYVAEEIQSAMSKFLQNCLFKKSTILLIRNEILSDMTNVRKLFSFYSEQLRMNQFYDSIADNFRKNVTIKAFLKIEKQQKQQKQVFRIYRSAKQVKGINIQSLLVSDKDSKKKRSEHYILRTGFKNYKKIDDLLQTLKNNAITKTALTGRNVDEFNEMFTQLCTIVLSNLEDYLKKRTFIFNLNKDYLARVIIQGIQDYIYEKIKLQKPLCEDLNLKQQKQKINKASFFQKQLSQISVDWTFLQQQYNKKVLLMYKQKSIQSRLKIFADLFNTIFTIVGFSVKKNKICAEMINPIIQYLVIESSFDKNFELLFSIQALKWGSSPEILYNLTLYESSIMYVLKNMSEDYPLPCQ